MPPLFGLAPGGVFHAGDVAAAAVRSCRTLSTLPAQRQAVSFLWHFPSIPLRASAGRYPAPLFRGARTFLASLAQAAAARPSGKQRYRRFRSSLREGCANGSECPLWVECGHSLVATPPSSLAPLPSLLRIRFRQEDVWGTNRSAGTVSILNIFQQSPVEWPIRCAESPLVDHEANEERQRKRKYVAKSYRICVRESGPAKPQKRCEERNPKRRHRNHRAAAVAFNTVKHLALRNW